MGSNSVSVEAEEGGMQTILAEEVSTEADDIPDKGQLGVWFNGMLNSNRNVIGHAWMSPVPEPHECHPSVHSLGHVRRVLIPWSDKQQVISESRRERHKSPKRDNSW